MAGSIGLACAARGGAVAWVVPTYKNARPVWRFTKTMTAQEPRAKVRETDRIAEFPGGGWLGVYSADNDTGIRGESFDLVIVDEAAQIAESTYTDVLMPTLADRRGRIMLISTPKGRNWFWQEWQKASTDKTGYSAAFTAPTSDNPLPNIRHAAELARERVSERTYRQEWLAEFVEDGAGVFRGIRQATTARRFSSREGVHQYVVGVDWGRTNDATVCAVVDLRTLECVHLDRMTGTDYPLQVTRLKGLCERFRPTVVLAEYNAMGGPLIEQLTADGLPMLRFDTTNATKARIIDQLALGFESGRIRIPDDSTLIAELEAYESQQLPSGLVRYGAPEGMHDDCVMALALAWHAATERESKRAYQY